MPTKGTEGAGAYDIYMPESGNTYDNLVTKVKLGFAAEIPTGYVALLLPRSGVGVNLGLELNNTCGVIDSDYRGEWIAAIRTKDNSPIVWKAGDRLIQFLIIPVLSVTLEYVDDLTSTVRDTAGFGSSGI
jgi:dUTP pyrophosphatase